MKIPMLKISCVFLLFFFLLTSCSNDDNEKYIEPDPSIKLVSSKTSIVPFEELKVSIDVDMDLLMATYDSITWQANGVVYIWIGVVFEEDKRDLRITDYRFGENKAYALGYKDGKVISKDSITYTVEKPTGDFLNIVWNTNKKDNYWFYTTGMTPNNYLPTSKGWTRIGGVSLDFSHTVENVEKEYALMYLMPWSASSNVKSTKTISIPDINDFDWDRDEREGDREPRYELEYDFLQSYMTELYGPSKYIYEGEDITQTTLKDKYEELFVNKYNNNDFYPAEIWVTPTTVICLVQANNYMGGAHQRGICAIIAEPLR